LKKKELEKFIDILLESAKRLEKDAGSEAKIKGKKYKPAMSAIRNLLSYMALIEEDPCSVVCEKRNSKIGFKATFSDGKSKFFTNNEN
jgi:hypothetical protein